MVKLTYFKKKLKVRLFQKKKKSLKQKAKNLFSNTLRNITSLLVIGLYITSHCNLSNPITYFIGQHKYLNETKKKGKKKINTLPWNIIKELILIHFYKQWYLSLSKNKKREIIILNILNKFLFLFYPINL